jgi:transposase-like protein
VSVLFHVRHNVRVKQVLHSLVGGHLRGVFSLPLFRHGAPMKQEIDLCTLIEQYGSEDRCREYMEELRWPEGVHCVKCSSEKISHIYDRHQFHCESCNHQFSVTAGTIFHDTHLPLWKWFLCAYLLCECRKGMSANQLKRTLGISYKTAWYLCHRIRKAMAEADGHKLKGTVEIDETYIGPKTTHAEQWDKKVPVIGIRERGGHVHFIQATPHLDQARLYEIIARNVDKSVDVIMTDESKLYGFGTTQYHKAKHETVNHSAKEYVRGDVTTNGIESAFSLLKRGIVGTWHRVSTKHLAAYLQEMTWRFNNRKNPFLFRDTLKRMIASDNLEFRELVA